MSKREKHTAILGISAYYHDSAAALVIDGVSVAAAHEERFTRIKQDATFPKHAVEYVLSSQGYTIDDLTAVVFYDKPILKFERLLDTYHNFAPKGIISFVQSMPLWLKQKLFTRKDLENELISLGGVGVAQIPLLFSEHHVSHMASAFYPSPFKEAAILTVDGVGEWATTTIGYGSGKDMKILCEMHFPHSLGLLYSAGTYFCGFRVNSGEYKLMGLAPYGEHGGERTEQFKKKIKEELISLKDDGSLFLNMRYFAFATELTMIHADRWEKLFGMPCRTPESDLLQSYMDFALALQEVTEEIMLRLARTAQELTGSRNLVLAGGVALNCVANAKIIQENIFDHVWIQPAAGDAGGALGAALGAYHLWGEKERISHIGPDGMSGSYLGPEYSELDIDIVVKKFDAVATRYTSIEMLVSEVAHLLSKGSVIGWMQGRMEWGPRSLGNRSILADPRLPDMQKKLNLKIKYREGFRPFAPVVREEDSSEYFEITRPDPYMLTTAPVKKERRLPKSPPTASVLERLYQARSDIPSVTHLDYSARVQTVSKETNQPLWKLLTAFKEVAGCGVLVNTSFNVRGEPIICTPEDAYQCFMNTEMDYLVIGTTLFKKENQPEINTLALRKYAPD